MTKEQEYRVKVIRDVFSFKSKHSEGLTIEEVNRIASQFPNFSYAKMNDALSGITGQLVENDCCIYRHDVITGLICGVMGRGIKPSEWD